MYSIENFDNLEKGTINRSEIAKRTILSNLKTINKQTLARLCSAVNYGLYEFVVYGQIANNITYFELKSEVKERLKDCEMH
jgi:hypothetical protein